MRVTGQTQAHAHTRGNAQAVHTTCVTGFHAYKIGAPCNLHVVDDRALTRGECRRSQLYSARRQLTSGSEYVEGGVDLVLVSRITVKTLLASTGLQGTGKTESLS